MAFGGFNYARRVLWDDKRWPAVGINPPGGASDPARNTTNGLLEFSASATNVVVIWDEMDHPWKEGSYIVPHVHWRKKTAGAGNVLWRLEYEWVDRGQLFTDVLTVMNASTVTAATPDDGAALRHLVTSFGELSMPGKRISCCGQLKLSRIGGDALDTYGGLAQLLMFDLHIQKDAGGSLEERDKGF